MVSFTNDEYAEIHLVYDEVIVSSINVEVKCNVQAWNVDSRKIFQIEDR